MRLKQKNRGFTLIELMIVVAIVAAVMVIAIPSYFGYAQKARRAEAKAALTGLTMAMERYYMEQSPSTYVGASLGNDPNDIYPTQIPLDAANKSYQLAITSTATAYTVSATPINSQVGDDCGVLSITSLGVKGSSTSTVDNCWN